MHTSLTAWWKPVEYVPKPHWNASTASVEWRANYARHRTWPKKPVVHDSAWLCGGGAYAQCLPDDAIRLSVAEQKPGLPDQFGIIP